MARRQSFFRLRFNVSLFSIVSIGNWSARNPARADPLGRLRSARRCTHGHAELAQQAQASAAAPGGSGPWGAARRRWRSRRSARRRAPAPVGQRQRLVDVMGDEQHRGPVGLHSRSTSRRMEIVVSASRALNGSSSSSRAATYQRAGQRARCACRRTGSAARPHPLGQLDLGQRVVATRVGSGARRPNMTLSSTRFQGTRRGSWKATATGSATAINPHTSRSSPASAPAGWTCPIRSARSGRRTRPPDVQAEPVQDHPVAEPLREVAHEAATRRSRSPPRRSSARSARSLRDSRRHASASVPPA